MSSSIVISVAISSSIVISIAMISIISFSICANTSIATIIGTATCNAISTGDVTSIGTTASIAILTNSIISTSLSKPYNNNFSGFSVSNSVRTIFTLVVYLDLINCAPKVRLYSRKQCIFVFK